MYNNSFFQWINTLLGLSDDAVERLIQTFEYTYENSTIVCDKFGSLSDNAF